MWVRFAGLAVSQQRGLALVLDAQCAHLTRGHTHLVALHAGAIVWPELQLPWWNLNVGAFALARLPGRGWLVDAGAGMTGPTEDRRALVGVAWVAPSSGMLIESARWWPWLPVSSALVLGASLVLACLRRPGVRGLAPAARLPSRACKHGTRCLAGTSGAELATSDDLVAGGAGPAFSGSGDAPGLWHA